MKTTLSHSQAMDILKQDDYAKWSYDAADALVTYYEEYEEEAGEEIELDLPAIRGDWNEYDNITDALDEYGKDNLEDLQDETQVIELDNGHVLVEAF